MFCQRNILPKIPTPIAAPNQLLLLPEQSMIQPSPPNISDAKTNVMELNTSKFLHFYPLFFTGFILHLADANAKSALKNRGHHAQF